MTDTYNILNEQTILRKENSNIQNNHILTYLKNKLLIEYDMKQINYYIGPWKLIGTKYVNNKFGEMKNF